MIQLKEEKRTLLDDVDIKWEITERETHAFRSMWNRQENIETIAKRLKRPVLEIGLLIVEQAELGEIEQRRNGIYW